MFVIDDRAAGIGDRRKETGKGGNDSRLERAGLCGRQRAGQSTRALFGVLEHCSEYQAADQEPQVQGRHQRTVLLDTSSEELKWIDRPFRKTLK